jgi:glycerol-3-phosphate O-acyltransferase/dihydroxyacetone phosphate acyltransferase
MRKLAARLLRWLAEVAVRFYYPRRSVEGLANVPAGGGALYVANHPNGLLDPLVLRVVIRRRVRFLAKSTLWGNPFGRLAMDAFECLPVYRQRDVGGGGRSAFVSRNEETFARCRAELATGAARIALGAAAEASATPEGRMPRLIPVGSRYENQALFRSGVHLVVGEAIDLRPYLATYSAVTGAEPNQAIADLTDAIRARLDVLVLQAETRELLEGVARVASWTGIGPGDDAPERLHARTRELLVAYAKLRSSDPERVERIAEQARAYARMLEKMGIRDPWALETPHLPLGRIAVTFARTLVLAPAVPWGLVTSWFPYRLAGFAARRATKDEDVLSTMKMIGGAAFLVAAWLIEAVVIGLLGGVGLGVLSLLIAPAAGYAALRFGEHVRATAEALRHLGWRTQGKTARHLAARRKRLAEDVAHALRQVGP